MTDQQLIRCRLHTLRLVYVIRQFDHYTVTENGEADVLATEEVDDSWLAAPP